MTPKEKAKELFDKHFEFVEALSTRNQIYNAKQCALITVDEIIDTHQWDGGIDYDEMRYWEQVKQEIKNITL